MTRPCVLRCRLYGTAKCAPCLIPDAQGRALCPTCRGRLYFLTFKAERAVWGCNNLTGCGASVTVPVGNVEREAEKQMSARDRRREQLAGAVRRHRARQKDSFPRSKPSRTPHSRPRSPRDGPE